MRYGSCVMCFMKEGGRGAYREWDHGNGQVGIIGNGWTIGAIGKWERRVGWELGVFAQFFFFRGVEFFSS